MSSSAITGPILSDVRRSPSGSAAAPSWSFADSTGTGVYLVSAGVLGLSTDGVQRVVVDASGNVGINKADPSAKLHIDTPASGTGAIFRHHSGTNNPGLFFSTTEATSVCDINASGSTGTNNLTFSTSNTERMRIDANGNLRLGTSSHLWAAGERLSVLGANVGTDAVAAWKSAGNHGQHIFMNSSNQLAGYISWTGTSTAYVGTSDYRLKEDVKPIEGALSKIAALKPCTYKWKVDGSEGEGFIAHELAEVCPSAVVGEKDAVNEDGSIKPQGIDPSKLVGLLTAAIQELSAKNDALEVRLAALEAKP